MTVRSAALPSGPSCCTSIAVAQSTWRGCRGSGTAGGSSSGAGASSVEKALGGRDAAAGAGSEDVPSSGSC